jgi:transitional endoplasmic reticulum ATPase
VSTQAELESKLVDPAYLWVLRLWILRTLLRCNGVANFLSERRFNDLLVARLLGFTDEQIAKYTEPWALDLLQTKLEILEQAPPPIPEGTTLARNLARLCARLALNDVERDILHFTALQRVQGEFTEALDMAGELTRATTCRLLSACLAHPIADVQRALDDRGKLSRSALLSVDNARTFRFGSKVDLLSGLAEDLLLEHDDLLSIFGSSVVPARPSRLTLDHFPHLAEDIVILKGYLEGAGRLQRAGVNVLVYGRPGTGKTEFVRAVVCALGATLLEIPTEELSGKPRAGRSRFESYRFAQSLLAGADRTVLLFDEVEDVFCDGPKARDDEGNTSGVKGWVNQLLEHNPVPTFWVTNHLRAIDPAYRRRFDYVLHLDMPPASVRRRVIDTHAVALDLPEDWLEGAARHPDMAPAVVERAAKVGTLVCEVLPDLGAAQVLTRVMNNTLHALGARRLPVFDADPGINYRLDLLNADCDLQRLQDGLARLGEGRLCLYGPPGTGKTAFGRHLAQVLDRPLLVKRASDILSPYVGMAERHIAEMFGEARSEGAVLLLDEADSLLRDRQGAQRSWEVTQVNEMLTQMEDFRGIFIASTNLMDSLDAAAMRRFDARIRLGYLGAEQAWEMFGRLTLVLELIHTGQDRPDLDRLVNLTPGDFASVERHCRLDPVRSAEELVARLRQASDAKRDPVRKSIGFMT